MLKFDLSEIRKAVAAGVSSAVVQAVALAAVAVGLDPVVVVPLGLALSAAAAKVVFQIPNEVSVDVPGVE
jgi:hypothetical protein